MVLTNKSGNGEIRMTQFTQHAENKRKYGINVRKLWKKNKPQMFAKCWVLIEVGRARLANNCLRGSTFAYMLHCLSNFSGWNEIYTTFYNILLQYVNIRFDLSYL